ncbi:MAG: circularly permuted type 2 ATP-grasp protein [Aquabacterium sp.]
MSLYTKPAIAGHWDEWRGGPDVAAHALPGTAWGHFLQACGPLDAAELSARERSVRDRVQEDGAGYNLHAASTPASQPWPLQLMPVLLMPEDWSVIAAGVQQRVMLMERVLADLYGPRQLLADALLPAALVQAHPAYLRPVHAALPPGGTWLHVAAFDLVRMPGGGWSVLAQRLQAPSGLGYMLENRLIIRQQFPQAFAAMGVQRLASGLRGLLDGLQRSSPAREQARVVMMTPGPLHETWFEQAFLARHLGLPLVEGQDLTVRSGRLYMKTLQGLERVDVVLRRVDDAWLDPVELQADSTLGVPGLLQAWRSGGVVLANAPGAGVLESPALAAFWPAVAQRLLGQPLLLPATPSWWCGEAAVWSAQRGRLDDWVVAPTFPGPAPQPVITAALSPAERRALRERVDQDPAAYTLLAPVAASQTPVWHAGSLDPRSMLLRVFALADGQGGWQVLPGAMARVAPAGLDARDAWLSFQHGSGSADTWVVTGDPVTEASLRPLPLSTAELTQSAPGVSSRAAENLFWLGRYAERCEHGLRLARLILQSRAAPASATMRWLDDQAMRQGWPTMVAGGAESSTSLLRALVDPGRPGSVADGLARMRSCALALQDRLSVEHWRLVQDADEHFREHLMAVLVASAGQHVPDALGVMSRTGLHLAAITGAHADRMVRDDGWRLLSVGRQLERLALLASALADALRQGAVDEPDGFDALLDLPDALTTYRARWQNRREVLPLLHLLALDLDHPRSLAWVARTLQDRLSRLARHESAWVAEVTDAVSCPLAWTLDDLVRRDEPAGGWAAVALLDRLVDAARGAAVSIEQRLFVHVQGPLRQVWQ